MTLAQKEAQSKVQHIHVVTNEKYTVDLSLWCQFPHKTLNCVVTSKRLTPSVVSQFSTRGRERLICVNVNHDSRKQRVTRVRNARRHTHDDTAVHVTRRHSGARHKTTQRRTSQDDTARTSQDDTARTSHEMTCKTTPQHTTQDDTTAHVTRNNGQDDTQLTTQQRTSRDR